MTENSNTKVLLLAANGLLGCTLNTFLENHGYDVFTHSRNKDTQYQADLSNTEATNALLDAVQPDVIINLVGLTDVELCEAQPNQAYLANVKTLENLSHWIKQSPSPCHLVHISTDQVYDGHAVHTEDSVVLSNCYAFSKYTGELVASSVPSTILRTNFFGLSHCATRRSFTDWLFDAIKHEKPIQVFDDILFSPLSMATLSEMIILVLQNKPLGIFNLGAHQGMSKADFAFTFAQELNASTSMMTRTSCNAASFLKAYRPKDMRMNCSHFENTLNIELPQLNDEIKRAAKEYV